LKRLPVDQIKIDRTFIFGMASDPADAAIVRSTIELAHNLRLRVVAEGVETREVWERLAALRCDLAQGFYLTRPLPADELLGWVRRTTPRDQAKVIELPGPAVRAAG
jgi:EAL domain-containing protein (putative c-di-GMP-specific phosphodiesterase class I)